MKNYIKHIAVIVLFAAGSVFAAATWQTTAGIEDGQIISAAQLKENLDYLYERSLPVCPEGSVLLATADQGWECGDAQAPEPEDVWLVNDQHTETQCSSLGGQVLAVGGGNRICRFTRGICPTGWAQYRDWKTTGVNTCNGRSGNPCWATSCSTGSMAWSDSDVNAGGTCNYRTGGGRQGDGPDGNQCEGQITAVCVPTITQVGCY